ncbi:MAG: DNA translocase FtsK [Leptolinea sp.]|jgi:S-DNA-T family DNA segregation ATPase FtsK/SpoIIIE|nr:DNA translocase FtsK [Leptolinea sp.]
MNSLFPDDENPAGDVFPDGIEPSSSSSFTDEKQSEFEWLGKDGGGILLVLISLLTLFGLTQISSGAFLTTWVQFLRRWFGWSSVLLAFLVGYTGIAVLRQPRGTRAYPLVQILGGEGLIFALSALLAVIGGNSVDRAGMGEDGGLIGWGLARMTQFLLPGFLNGLLWLGVLVLMAVATFWPVRHVVLRTVNKKRRTYEPERQTLSAQEKAETPKPVQHSLSSLAEILKDDQSEIVDETIPPVKKRQNDRQKPGVDRLPPINLLSQEQTEKIDPQVIHQLAGQIEVTLTEFGVPSTVTGYRIGPTVTQFAVEPGYIEKTGIDGNITRQKIRVAQISALSRDLALALKARRLRIEAPVPGQSFLGIEIPNSNNAIVRLRPILESEGFQKNTSPLALALGKDVSGNPVIADLAKMPHLLVAGTTGSGKSVCISALITCLIMNNSPADLRLAILDPKKVELVRFNGLPHLLGHVETTVERMLGVLRWGVVEMENRYKLLESQKSRDIDAYNRKMQRKGMDPLPRIVILVDEMADLMMSAPDQTEQNVVRLAQMARGVGIHLVVATQRPSTDVVTGVIKANFPARIAFTVASAIDSRVILDVNGAETLLGRGDMLFLNSDASAAQRVQGVMVTDTEIDKIVTFWRKMMPPQDGDVVEECPWEKLVPSTDELNSDALVEQAIEMVRGMQKASASLLQRKMRIGYPRAARLMDEMEKLGVVGPINPGGRERDVLVSRRDEDSDGDDNPG